MKAAEDPRTIVIRFPEDSSKPPELELGAEVTIGQLVGVAWELEHYAEDARRGQLMAQASRGLVIPGPPVLGGNGGH